MNPRRESDEFLPKCNPRCRRGLHHFAMTRPVFPLAIDVRHAGPNGKFIDEMMS